MITADTITDEQIKWIWKNLPNAVTGATLMEALGEPYGPEMRVPTHEAKRKARAACANAFNERTEGPVPVMVIRSQLRGFVERKEYERALDFCDAAAVHPVVPLYAQEWLGGFAHAMHLITCAEILNARKAVSK